jgi:hypothetical protein
MKTNARMKSVKAKIAPMIVHKQSVHFRSFSKANNKLTFDGQFSERIQRLLEHESIYNGSDINLTYTLIYKIKYYSLTHI